MSGNILITQSSQIIKCKKAKVGTGFKLLIAAASYLTIACFASSGFHDAKVNKC